MNYCKNLICGSVCSNGNIDDNSLSVFSVCNVNSYHSVTPNVQN